jgi:putative ABC transport system permease protein
MRWFGRPDGEYREEMDAHIDQETRENLERGMGPDEARRAALRKFGNALAVREKLADERPLHWWHDLYRDFSYGMRMLKRNPGVSAAVVVTLALGIGANTAIFSLVDAVLLRMLPVRDPQSLVVVRALTRAGKPDWFSHTDYEWLRDHNQMFSSLAASAPWSSVIDAGDRKERVSFLLVSGNYFSTLGVEPTAGRLLTPEDDSQKRAVAVISYGYWQSAFGGRPDAVGGKLQLDRKSLEIVGVAPRGFRGEYENRAEYYPRFWTPLSEQPDLNINSYLKTRNISWLGVVGRLRPGIDRRRAQAGARPMLEALRADLHVDPQNDYLGGIGMEPGSGGLSGTRDQYGQALRLLMALVALVLLIACANIANLLLARSAARRREFAVRLAIGAGRMRLVRQLLTESVLMAGIACVAGMAIGQAMVRAVVAMSGVKDLDVHVNVAILGFAVAISCGAALAFGLAPALQSNRVDPWTTLKEARLAGDRAGWLTPTRFLVVTQTALSLVLLIASGLLLRTFLKLKAVSPGFDEQVLQANLDTALVPDSGVDLGDRLVERLAQIPGVQSVSFSRFGAIGSGTGRTCCFAPEGYTPAPNEDKNVRTQTVSPGYFRTLGIALLRGRDFNEADRKGAKVPIVVNETLARYYFGTANPVGRRFGWGPDGPKDWEIVGVVRDAKYDNLRQETPRLLYRPAQGNQGPDHLEIRALADVGRPTAAAILGDCRAAMREVDSRIRITSFEPLADVVGRSLTPERMVSWLAAGFGILALLLTSVGLYGILAYMVARRTAEFGIRMALGAGRMSIVRAVLREGLVLVGIGLAIGLTAAVSLSRLLGSLLFGVEPHDVLTFALAAAVLVLVAMGASYGPARRATGIDPMIALRCE